MPSGFYVLQRFYMRVDHVVYRIFETRVYHSFGQDQMIREYTEREIDVDHLSSLLNEPKSDSLRSIQPDTLVPLIEPRLILSEICFHRTN
jgi:type 2A phosphatase activator TIP41